MWVTSKHQKGKKWTRIQIYSLNSVQIFYFILHFTEKSFRTILASPPQPPQTVTTSSGIKEMSGGDNRRMTAV